MRVLENSNPILFGIVSYRTSNPAVSKLRVLEIIESYHLVSFFDQVVTLDELIFSAQSSISSKSTVFRERIFMH